MGQVSVKAVKRGNRGGPNRANNTRNNTDRQLELIRRREFLGRTRPQPVNRRRPNRANNTRNYTERQLEQIRRREFLERTRPQRVNRRRRCREVSCSSSEEEVTVVKQRRAKKLQLRNVACQHDDNAIASTSQGTSASNEINRKRKHQDDAEQPFQGLCKACRSRKLLQAKKNGKKSGPNSKSPKPPKAPKKGE